MRSLRHLLDKHGARGLTAQMRDERRSPDSTPRRRATDPAPRRREDDNEFAAGAGDATGASGTGLLGAILVDAVAPGNATLTLSGAGTGPGGTPMGLQFRPVTITIQP